MTAQDVALPTGYRLAFHELLDSTNAEALRRAAAGEAGHLWVWAAAQSAGRGRSGRQWESLSGNLFASLLLRPACGLETALQLVLVAGLAAHDTVAGLLDGGPSDPSLTLKWPNDLLLGDEKVAGILIESMSAAPETGCTVVVGTGINLAAHPGQALYPATNLASHGLDVAPGDAFERLAEATVTWLEVWREGAGIEAIRQAWEARAIAIGRPIRVRLATGDLEGTYAGIDETGALRLAQADGSETRVTAADVFLTPAPAES